MKVFRDTRIGGPLWSFHETPCPEPDRLRLVSRVPSESIFEAEMACPGLMVAGDNYYRGWRAWVDGRRIPIQEFDGVRAVRLSKGQHRVEFRYRPTSVYVGAGLSLIGLALTAVITSRR
jgi:hypothetical protein